jgi:nitroreductase
MLSLAGLAPSGCNAQPWIVHIVSGEATARLSAALCAKANNEEPFDPDFPITTSYPGLYRQRQLGSAVALFAAQNIPRHYLAARNRSFLRNFSFFGAPHVAFLFLHEAFALREALDCGLFVQTFLLALTAHGLASCPQGALSHYATAVHDALNVPLEHRLLIGLAFGYADIEHETRNVQTDRASLNEIVTFHDG